jgi:hypothetical protein
MLATLSAPPIQIFNFLGKKAIQAAAWTIGINVACTVLGPVAMAAFHPGTYAMGTAIGSFFKTTLLSCMAGPFEMVKWPLHVLGGLVGQYTPLEHIPFLGNLFKPELLQSTALGDGVKNLVGGTFQNISHACLGAFGQPIDVPGIMINAATPAKAM